MIIRNLVPSDLEELRKIHSKFYKNEFSFPLDRFGVFSNKFVITDDSGQIITFGMLELSAEAIVLTNKNVEGFKKYKALVNLLPILSEEAKQANLNNFTASIYNDPIWQRNLLKAGFKESKGSHLFYKIGD